MASAVAGFGDTRIGSPMAAACQLIPKLSGMVLALRVIRVIGIDAESVPDRGCQSQTKEESHDY
jgi:hypothetical protein